MEEESRQEGFVDADAIARSLGETRRYVLYLARTGAIRSYPLGGRERIKRKFLISEVKSDLVGRKRKIRRNRGEVALGGDAKVGLKPKIVVMPRTDPSRRRGGRNDKSLSKRLRQGKPHAE